MGKIVLDAGHGGDKPGAIGHFSQEKDIALAVTLQVGELMKKNMKDRQVIYTRTTDIDVPLAERHEIANRAKADLFVSIHVNSTPGTRTKIRSGSRTVKRKGKSVKVPNYIYKYDKTTEANGTETYVLGLSRNNQKVESIGEYSDNLTGEKEGLMDESDPMTAIIIAQYSQAFLASSVDLGARIQGQFAKQGRLDRGVKQISVEVLAGCVMPGVLVEIGFINNVEEEKYMNSPQGQTEIAHAIYNGILEYIKAVEG
ncbi:MAG: N-acetylmuramoyl-L-alanine amidase [Taibaiella sp.]|nr:N-acetylmuramoyl-L-alanine amidase [Taibaiella sp.]